MTVENDQTGDQPKTSQRVAVMCIGNALMLDEGVGPRIAETLLADYVFPENIDVLDSGTMGMTLLSDFKNYDFILVVDAVDGTGEPAGTVVRFLPEEMAPHTVSHSLHDIRFVDVLQAAMLIGYEPQGECVGVQIENMFPENLTIGLTPDVEAAIPLAIETVFATLYGHGVRGITKKDGTPVGPDEEPVAQ